MRKIQRRNNRATFAGDGDRRNDRLFALGDVEPTLKKLGLIRHQKQPFKKGKNGRAVGNVVLSGLGSEEKRGVLRGCFGFNKWCGAEIETMFYTVARLQGRSQCVY
jgi:hypothetical protein